MANLSVPSPGKWTFSERCFDKCSTFFGHLDIFPKNEIRALDPCSTRVDLSRSPDCTLDVYVVFYLSSEVLPSELCLEHHLTTQSASEALPSAYRVDRSRWA